MTDMDLKLASALRQQIQQLRERRNSLEDQLLVRRRMLRASFLERYLGTRRSKRRKPAYYLSYRKGGKTVLEYVRAEGRSGVRERAEAWGEFTAWLAEWVQLGRELERNWRELGQAQAEEPGGGSEG